MKILGISAFYHDSAAAIIEDGKLIGTSTDLQMVSKYSKNNNKSI